MDDATTTPEPAPGQQLWGGLTFSAWLRLLARHHFAVDRSFRSVALRNTAVSFLTSLLRFVQVYRYGREVARTPITEPPLFVLGFYRSGTTMLHNLLGLDPRHTFPNTYQCFMPNHFLLTEDFVTSKFPLDVKRAMDNVPMTWDQPQEDEFALCMMGQPSFHLSLAFPNAPPQDLDFLSLEGVPRRARAAWKRSLYRFLQAVTLKRPGRLVIKSPPHTARIKLLLEMFPEARFVHIIRDPYRVYDSTIKMFKAMAKAFGLQQPTEPGQRELLLNMYPWMLTKLEEGRARVDPSRFYELHYETLVKDPVNQLKAMYDHLALGDFEVYRPHLEAYLAGTKDYRTNRHPMPLEVRAMITQRWGDIIRRYGYADEPAPAPT